MVGVDDIPSKAAQTVVVVVLELLAAALPNGSAHALDLTVCPWMV